MFTRMYCILNQSILRQSMGLCFKGTYDYSRNNWVSYLKHLRYELSLNDSLFIYLKHETNHLGIIYLLIFH
jgi:hypothetical protein